MRWLGGALALALGMVLAAMVAAGAARRPAASICDNVDVMRPCSAEIAVDRAHKRDRSALVSTGRDLAVTAARTRQRGLQRLAVAMSLPAAVRLEHPAGCPRRAFCGCGVAVRVFGWPVRELWLAVNWLKFPKAPAAVGMVAVKQHHVFYLEQHLGGSTWLAYDPNSGRHATQRHARSIDGFVIVNPRAG
jgi:hypothetical protein